VVERDLPALGDTRLKVLSVYIKPVYSFCLSLFHLQESKTMKFPALLILCLVSASCTSVAYDCTDPLGCLEISAGDHVVIGAILTVFGRQGAAGLQVLEEIRSAIKEQDLILGHEIDLAWQGDDCSSEDARLSATQLARTPDLLAIIGPTCESDAQTVLPIFEAAGLPVLPPSSSVTDTFQRLVSGIEQVAIQQTGGTLIIPLTALQQSIQDP
jgi:ABC-type branched-subunit amino acid transport system substrate-binding protein